MHARKALLPDAPYIHELISLYSGDGTLLPRTQIEICENIRDFTVVVADDQIIGCAAFHIYGLSLAEVRSVTVNPQFQGRHAGTVLVQALLTEAQHHQVERVFLFTRAPDFFSKLGFTIVPHGLLPEKVFKDCMACPRRQNCDEIAMVHGTVSADELKLVKDVETIIALRNGLLNDPTRN